MRGPALLAVPLGLAMTATVPTPAGTAERRQLRSHVAVTVAEARPTPLFPRVEGGAAQEADTVLDNPGGATDVTVTVSAGARRVRTRLAAVPPGRSTHKVLVPDVSRPRDAVFTVSATGRRTRTVLPWRPGRHWNVFLVPSSHVDLYSTLNARYTPEEHARALDRALDLARRYPEYRYQSENSIPIFEYLRLRPEDRRRDLLTLLREGRFAVGAQYTGVHQEQATGENLVQGQLGALGGLAGEGIRANSAMTLDVPNATAQFAQLLRSAGIPYWVYAPNVGYDHYADMGLPLVFRWTAPDGSRVLATRTSRESYNGAQTTLGLDAGATLARAEERVPARLAELEADPSYPYDALYALLSAGDNAPPREEPVLVAREWNAKYAWPRLVFATNSEYFSHMEEAYGDRIPVLEGNEILDVWAYLVANEGPLAVWDRDSSRRVLAAQRLAAALWARGIAPYPQEDVDAVFELTARTEAHDWFYGAVPIPGTSLKIPLVAFPDFAKRRWAKRAQETAQRVHAQSLRALAGAVETAGAGRSLVVWNPSSWRRDDVVVVPLPKDLPPGPFRLRDGTTGADVAYQILDDVAYETNVDTGTYSLWPPRRGGDGPRLAFVARDVDPVGYRVYRVEPGAGPPPTRSSLTFDGVTLSNRFFSVRLDPASGGIVSILDRRSGRELVDASRWRANQMIVGEPETDPVWILRVWWETIFPGSPGPFGRDVWKLLSARSVKTWRSHPAVLAAGLSGPVMASAVLSGPLGRDSRQRRQAVVLYEDVPRIDFVNSLDWKDPPYSPVRVAVAFPFAVPGFTARHDVPFGEITAGANEAPTAPRVHRQLQTWVDFSGPEGGVTLAARDQGVFTWGRPDLDLVEDRSATVPETAAAFPVVADSGAYSFVQLGRSQSRFSLVPHGADAGPSDRHRTGWEANLPLAAAWAPAGARAGALPEGGEGFVSLTGPADLSALARSQDGDALVARLVETAGTGGIVELDLGRLPVAAAYVSNAYEDRGEGVPLDGAKVRVRLRPREVLTLRLETS